METAHAKLSQYRQSPRKVRLVADFVRGKSTKRALADLSQLPKRATVAISTLLKSAIANAKNKGLDEKHLFVKEIRVDEGTTLSRWRARARGRAGAINKRTSHISLVLEESKKETK